MAVDNADAPKSIVRTLFYEIINNNNYALAPSCFNPKFRLQVNGRQISGSRKFVTELRKLAASQGKIHTEIITLIEEGDLVCAHWKLIVKSGAEKVILSTSGITIFRFRANEIVQAYQQWDAKHMNALFECE